MGREQQQFQKRIRELEEISWQESRFMFTGFLNEAEYADVLSLGTIACGMQAFGGYEGAGRVMVRFGDPQEFGYEEPFPIVILRIAPLMDKFADKLTHRDFLGAILNLGIERRVIGDILIDHATGYVMCEDRMASYITETLTRVKHTSVRVEAVDSLPDSLEQRRSEQDVQVASGRIDAVIAQVFHLSRSAAQELLHTGQVFVNGREITQSSMELNESDLVSVRHCGKFRYIGLVRTTRKGKQCVRIERFI